MKNIEENVLLKGIFDGFYEGMMQNYMIRKSAIINKVTDNERNLVKNNLVVTNFDDEEMSKFAIGDEVIFKAFILKNQGKYKIYYPHAFITPKEFKKIGKMYYKNIGTH